MSGSETTSALNWKVIRMLNEEDKARNFSRFMVLNLLDDYCVYLIHIIIYNNL